MPSHNQSQQNANHVYNSSDVFYIDGLVQERRNSNVLAIELAFLALTHWYVERVVSRKLWICSTVNVWLL